MNAIITFSAFNFSGAAVVARTSPSGDPELVAYAVLDPGTDADAVATRLRAVLPRYLVPNHWVVVDRLPVNANGKLDRDRLPDPTAADVAGAEPESPLEQTLHELWCAELGRTRVPVDRSFFALGGHSPPPSARATPQPKPQPTPLSTRHR